jgi:hypothetical protein
LKARRVYFPNTRAHGIQTAKGQLFSFIGQATEHLVYFVRRLERECRETSLYPRACSDESVNDRQEIVRSLLQSALYRVKLVESILEDDI